MPELNFDRIVDMIDNIKALIEKFVDMLTAFVDSFKKVPGGAIKGEEAADDAE